MQTLIFEDADVMTFERVTPNGVIVETIPKNTAGQYKAYKSAAVKIAAEKLGLLAAIEAAIMALVDKASDKALYVWLVETDTISRGDTQWIEIEPAVSWGKSSTDDLFALAAQV